MSRRNGDGSRMRTRPRHRRWRDSVAFMAGKGVTTFYEIGAGKVLSGLIRRIAGDVRAVAIGAPGDVAAFKAR